jgi:MFS transporter, SP family, solute carrier family 2 (myo-inositol transporter), member 13
MTSSSSNDSARLAKANLFLLLVAGLGGLLYGIDVGIIGGALPYLEATSGLTAAQLSMIVAAVLLGTVISTLFAGAMADWLGRKPVMVLSGLAFAISIPVIALSQSFSALFLGRLLQGASGGFIGVVVPLYLAECLPPDRRGKGTAIFQLMLTIGILAAALMGVFFSYRLQDVASSANADAIFQFKDHAWRSIFWVSMPPGLLFAIGAILIRESPRWLFRKGRKDQARAVLNYLRAPAQAALEFEEMEQVSTAPAIVNAGKGSGSLLRRKYVLPFLLACAILSLNTATGINSVIGYFTGILLQSGLSDLYAHWSYVALTAVNVLATTIGMQLVDRKGRKFLLTLGTGGLIVVLVTTGISFVKTEKQSIDARELIQAKVTPEQELSMRFDPAEASRLLDGRGQAISPDHASLTVIYSYGDFTAATTAVRSDDSGAKPIHVSRADAVPDSGVKAFFQNPLGDLKTAQTAPLHIDNATLSEIPEASHGKWIAFLMYCFIAFYAMGPGVCVWVALSELMPTRIRSNGMSVALLLNQLVSATFLGIFLPFVAKHGYSSMFFVFAGLTGLYFLTAAFLLPETKGQSLEDIEAHFEGRAAKAR